MNGHSNHLWINIWGHIFQERTKILVKNEILIDYILLIKLYVWNIILKNKLYTTQRNESQEVLNFLKLYTLYYVSILPPKLTSRWWFYEINIYHLVEDSRVR